MRFLTACILFPFALYLIFYLTPMAFAAASLILFTLCLWEWSNLMNVSHYWQRLGYIGVMLLLVFNIRRVPMDLWFVFAFTWWLTVTYLVVGYPRFNKFWSNPTLIAFMSVPTLIPFCIALNVLRQTHLGPWLLMYVLSLVWVADIGAYGVGRLWGKAKLLPKVSPGKTWMGVIGGFVLAVLYGLAAAYYFLPGLVSITHGWRQLALLVMVTIIASMFGDLLISVLKRERGIKDSGRLLPGHGGILDRVDSLTAALPVFVCGVMYIGGTVH